MYALDVLLTNMASIGLWCVGTFFFGEAIGGAFDGIDMQDCMAALGGVSCVLFGINIRMRFELALCRKLLGVIARMSVKRKRALLQFETLRAEEHEK